MARKIVYVKERCSACHEAVEELQKKGEPVEVRDATKLLRGEKEDHFDTLAMAELQMNDNTVPVILEV